MSNPLKKIKTLEQRIAKNIEGVEKAFTSSKMLRLVKNVWLAAIEGNKAIANLEFRVRELERHRDEWYRY